MKNSAGFLMISVTETFFTGKNLILQLCTGQNTLSIKECFKVTKQFLIENAI